MLYIRSIMIVFIWLTFSANSLADEHLFNLAYTSEVLPKGGMEFQQLIASRWDKGMGSYLANDLETELEYGITDRLQISGYLLTQDIHIKNAFPHEAVDDGFGNISEGDRLSHNGTVRMVDIMDYRETYGYQVREAAWRQQFVGKNAASSLKLNNGIDNISGATLSSKHLADGVKRVMTLYDLVLKPIK